MKSRYRLGAPTLLVLAFLALACGVLDDLVPGQESQAPVLPTSILTDAPPVLDADLVASNCRFALSNVDSFRWKEQYVGLLFTSLEESTATGEFSARNDMVHGHMKRTWVYTGETVEEMEFLQPLSCCKAWIREPGQSWKEHDNMVFDWPLHHTGTLSMALRDLKDASVQSTSQEGRPAYILETHPSYFGPTEVGGEWKVLVVIDAENWLPFSLSAQFRDSDGAITTTVEAVFYDFNAPISIEPPQAAD